MSCGACGRHGTIGANPVLYRLLLKSVTAAHDRLTLM
jgi:hypothetical protein